MNENKSAPEGQVRLEPYLSPLAVWALSVGSAIGWGSLVVTSRTYLNIAGPLGSILGLLLGFAMMLIMSSHYHFLANRYPGTGGLYNYVKYIFGYDRAFLVAWFLFLVYIAIFWANATSIPLFARYFLRGVFKVGYLYTVYGYDVYLGEALVTLVVMALMALLCAGSKRATARCIEIMVLMFTIGITVVFIGVMFGRERAGVSTAPAFVPDKGAFRQVMHIAFISPWAFIGFESVSHSAAEYHFKHTNMFRVLVQSVIVTTALYIFILLISVSAYPEGCASWLDYVRNLDAYEGIEGLPTFYAAYRYLGNAGVYILMASLLALVLSSLIGMMRALSRLCYAVAQDGILPERYSHLNAKQIPVKTIMLVAAVSLPIPFVGRTAIGWVVDTTTIGATIIYGFAAAAVLKAAREEGSRKDTILGGLCMFILVAFLGYLFFPGLFVDNDIESETYLLMAVWAILGLFFFNLVIRKDHARKFGKAIIVWVALLAFIVMMVMTIAQRLSEGEDDKVIGEFSAYLDGTADGELLAMDEASFLERQRDRLHHTDTVSVLLIDGVFVLSLGVMMVNYSSMRKWEKKTAAERDHARSVAFTDPLTGVKSKHAFAIEEHRMEEMFTRSEVEPFGVLVCDVNGLKHINDTLGHKAGDAYICAACRLLCEYYKHSPVFRIGGDEFVVLLRGQDFAACHELQRDFNAEVEKHIASGEVVASLGMAVYDPEEDHSFHDVFKRADKLMYERKMQLKRMGAKTRD